MSAQNDNILPADGAAFTVSPSQDSFLIKVWFHKKGSQDVVTFLDFAHGTSLYSERQHYKASGLDQGATYVVRILDSSATGITETEVTAKSAPQKPVISEIVAKEGLLTATIKAEDESAFPVATSNFLNVMLVKDEKIYYLKAAIRLDNTYQLINENSVDELRALYGTIFINAEVEILYEGSSAPSRGLSSALQSAFMSNMPDDLRSPQVTEDAAVFASVKYPLDASDSMPNTTTADLYKMKFTVSGKKANGVDLTYTKTVDIDPSSSPSTAEDIELSRQELLTAGFPLGAKLEVKIESTNIYSGTTSNAISFEDKRLIDSNQTSSLAPQLEVLSASLQIVSDTDAAIVTMKSGSNSASDHGIAIIGDEPVIASTGQRILSFKFVQDIYSRKTDVLSDLLAGNNIATGQDEQRSPVNSSGQAQFTFKVAIDGANDDADSEVKGMVLVENIAAIKGLGVTGDKSLVVSKQFVTADQEQIEIKASYLAFISTSNRFGLGIYGDNKLDQLPLKVTYDNGDITEDAFDISMPAQKLYVASQLSKKAVTVALSKEATKWKEVLAGHMLAMTAAGATNQAAQGYTVVPSVSIADDTYPGIDALLNTIADISVSADYAVKVPLAVSGSSVARAGDGDEMTFSWTHSDDDLRGATFVSFEIKAELYKSQLKDSEKTYQLSEAEWQSGTYTATAVSDPTDAAYELGQTWKFSGKLSTKFAMRSDTAEGSETDSTGSSSSSVSVVPMMKAKISTVSLSNKGVSATVQPMGNPSLSLGYLFLDPSISSADNIQFTNDTKSGYSQHLASVSIAPTNSNLSEAASKFFLQIEGSVMKGEDSAHNFNHTTDSL